MARTTPVNSGYTIINGTTRGTNVTEVDTWIEYKVTSQSIANNTSTIRVILYSQARRTATTRQEGTPRQYGYVQIDSGTKYWLSTTFTFENHNICKFADHTFTVTHNTNGTKTITISGDFDISAYVGPYLTGGSAQGTVTLPTIPQYASITQTLASKTETSINITWTTDETVDQIWYSTDDGSTWSNAISVNATSGSYAITGLAANTTYQIKTRVRNKTSQLTSDSTALSVATYQFPYCSTMPNFELGDAVTLGFYNPLGREITFKVIGANNTELTPTWTISGTSYTGLNDMASTVAQLYQQIPNATSGTYKVKVTYGSSVITQTGGTYSAKASNSSPEIGSFTYADVNASTTAITGDSSKIIQNHSTVRYTVGSITTKYGASVASVSVSVNNQTYALSQSGSNYVGGNAAINSGTNVTATVTLTDSRGFTATSTVTVQMLYWATPSAIINIFRQNNFYSESFINVDATYSYLNGTNTVTIRYRKKKRTDSTYDSWVTIQDAVDSPFTADNLYEWDFEIQVTDRLGSATFTRTLGKGMPLVFFDRLRASVGINCFPDSDNALWVNGIDYTYKTGTVTLASGWQVYSGATPLVRRQGRTVYLNGVVQPTGTVTLDTNGVDIGTIDDPDMRPTETVFVLCQGSGTSLFFLRVYTNGKIHIERLRDMANANGTYNNGTSSMWFPFSVSWII